MNIPFLTERLHANNIRLIVQGGELRVQAPKGVLDDTILSVIKYHKSQLLSHLTLASSLLNPSPKLAKAKIRRQPVVDTDRRIPTDITKGLIGQVIETFSDQGVEIKSVKRHNDPGSSGNKRSSPQPADLTRPLSPPSGSPRFITTVDTQWNEPPAKTITIPAGTAGHVVDLDRIGIPDDERHELDDTVKRQGRHRVGGCIVLFGDRLRFLQYDDFEFMRQPRRSPVAAADRGNSNHTGIKESFS